MNIVLLNDDFPLEGGNSVAHMTKILAEELRSSGQRVTIITTHRVEDDKNILTSEGKTLISIPVSYRTSLRHYLSIYNPRVSIKLKKILNQLNPDVVHAHNIHQYLTYNSLRIARKYTDKVFLTCHDVMSITYGRLANKRYLESEGKDVHLNLLDHIRIAKLQVNPLRNFFIKRLLNNVQVIAVSNALKKALQINGITNVKVIHNGVRRTNWEAQKEQMQKTIEMFHLKDKKIVLFAGRIRRDKGIIPLLKTLKIIKKKVSNVLLVAVGEKDRWEGLLKESGLQDELKNSQMCTGWMSHKELAALYGISNVVVTPSICLDTFNLINLEAMTNGKPVVGTCFGGTPEVVEDGKTGFIKNPLKIEEFADAIIKLLDNADLSEKMGQAGSERAKENFSIEKMAQEYIDIYKVNK